MNETKMERYARELIKIAKSDPFILNFSERVTGEELDYAIYDYIREKVDGRSFIYADFLRSFVVKSLVDRGFTRYDEDVCRVMQIFRRKFKGGKDSVEILL